jgi:hypothetical protein
MEKATTSAVSEDISKKQTVDGASVPTMIEITKENEGEGEDHGCPIA